jgi:hypothetical protein
MYRTVREICGNLHEISQIVKRRLSQFFFGQRFEQDYHSLQMADRFALHCEYSFAHL